MDLNTVFDCQAATVSREHSDAHFTYFTAEEIRSVSVQEITSGATADRSGEAMPEGLHAPSLGPMESELNRNPICPTCGLDRDCPGHMGRVELAMLCYNPFLFTHLHKLLNHICMDCSMLRCGPQVKRRFIEELNLLVSGRIPSAGQKMAATRGMKSAIEMDINRELGKFDAVIEDHTIATRQRVPIEPCSTSSQSQVAAQLARKFFEAAKDKTSQDATATKEAMAANPAGLNAASLFTEGAALDAWRDVTKSFMLAVPKNCQNCASKTCGRWRKDGFAKLFVTTSGLESFALPEKVCEIVRKAWVKEADLLGWLFPCMREHGEKMFFIENLLVPPNRFRPPALVGSSQMTLSKQTSLLREVLDYNQDLRAKIIELSSTDDPDARKAQRAEFVDTFVMLQNAVNNYMDSAKSGKHPKNAVDGIRQLLEKKEGLFRMKMMGKRVNFAARSVISPDLNVETSEIGIPQMIAQELAYPETAGPHNAERLRDLVLRGPEYPGATEVHVPQTDGSKVVKNLRRVKYEQREALAKQLITDVESGRAPMTVFRQLQDGDPLLVNRQPTLHKPGIMAHTAKVLRFEKTIRMHYANCNTYNADFDGDEMNLHAPQDPISRIEAMEIARADKQYLVPTSGRPLRGLIQDHVIAGVMLSKRDTLFNKSDACLLVYAGLRAAVEGTFTPIPDSQRTMFRDRPWLNPKVRGQTQKVRVKLDPPCVWKPVARWSGKQVFSMVLKNIIDISSGKDAKAKESTRPSGPKPGSGMSFESKSKTPGDIWNAKFDGNKEEASVFFQDTELLRGVLDKSQFGASDYGLVHAVFEMVGSRAVGMLLSSIARLFSTFLQIRGFTCAFADLVLHRQADEDRARLIKASRSTAKAISEDWLDKHKGEFEKGAPVHHLSEAAKHVWAKDRIACQDLEGMMLGAMKNSWGEVVNAVFPHGTKLPFPRNCFAAMVQTGAKGTKVNQSQVTCCLGQQELEGRAPPLMITRRALPCFAPYDMASRTRGYITDRFLTGIRPQEFFFHCMAGREGLVDTAVKTSRSGYLQRSLVKHLESLKVCYDLSVRDADGSVVQFMYGEDGLDVTQASHLYKFDSLHSNFKMLSSLGKVGLEKFRALSPNIVDQEAAQSYHKAQDAALAGDWTGAVKALSVLLNSEEIAEGAKQQIRDTQRRLKLLKKQGVSARKAKGALDPISSVLPPSHFFGSTSEAHEAALQKHLATKSMNKEDAAQFADYMRLKFMRSLAHPGEAVGVIAAQSMGEPSTQMTLNTFHLAGHGGANVTLGIPRLREIIQTGGSSNSTPSMRLEVLGDPHSRLSRSEQAHMLTKKFRHVTLQECLKSIVVHDQTLMQPQRSIVRKYHVRMEFWPLDALCQHVPHLTPQRLEVFLQKEFMRRLKVELKRYTTAVTQATYGKSKASAEEGQAVANSRGGEGDEGDGGEDVDEELKPKEAKRRKRVTDDDDGPDEDENKGNDDDGGADSSGMYSGGEENEDEAPQRAQKAESDAEDIIEPTAGATIPGKGIKAAGAADGFGTDDEEELFDGGEQDEAQEPSSKRRAKEPEKPRPASSSSPGPAGANDLMNSSMSNQAIWVGEMRDNTASFVLTLSHKDCGQRLLVTEMVAAVCQRCELQDENAVGIKKVTVRNDKDKVFLDCEGVNLLAFNLMPEEAVDHRKMYTNDISSVLAVYGIEAARAAVVNEVKSVFGHYGIEVNHRHLSLIADYMSMGGRLRPFSRIGIDHSASPLQQMSYETTMQFLTKACNVSNADLIASPASALVVGAVPPVGTGMVNLLMDLDQPKQKARRREFKFG